MKMFKIFGILFIACFWGCDFSEDFYNCKELGDSGNFSNKVMIGKYHSLSKTIVENNEGILFDVAINEVLELEQDSSYRLYGLDSLGDTLKVETGRFSIHKTPKSEWTGENDVYGFVFMADSATNALPVDSILLDVRSSDSCFTLAVENQDDFCHGYHYYSANRVFCANPEKL